MSARGVGLGLALAIGCGGSQLNNTPPTPAQILKLRPYELRVPPTPSTAPRPLVIGLHGYASSAPDFESEWQLGPETDARGALYTALDGTDDRQGNEVWNATPNNNLYPYDLLYLDAVIEDVASKQPLDRKRIYVVGISNGAFMAYKAACELSPKVAAILSLSGQSPVDAKLCHATTPVNILEVHGDHDADIAYDGSGGPGAKEEITTWGQWNGCAGKLVATGAAVDVDVDLPGAETVVSAVQGCPAGGASELWTVKNGVHHPNLVAGWPKMVMDWLLAHPKP